MAKYAKRAQASKQKEALAGIPARLAKIRGNRSQRQFATELGVFQQNVNRYEHGTRPRAEFLVRLAQKEGVSIDWLLTGRGEPYLEVA